jgi:hypothetical protein
MRRLGPAALAALTALGLVACGGPSHSGSVPLDTALSYFPQSTPFVATVDTKLDAASGRALESAENGETSSALVKAALFSKLAQLGIDYNRDLKPLLGNPIAVGVGGLKVSGSATPFLLAWQTDSATALAHLLADLKGATKTGTHDGATTYTLGRAALATHGALLLISDNAATISTALDRHRAGVGFSSAEYSRDTQGLPSGLVSIVGDLQSALDTPKTAQARKVPWVAAITGYGASLNATRHAVSVHFRLDTSGRTLTADELPVVSGGQAPGLAGSLPIEGGLRDPAQVYAFILDATRSAGPHAYTKLRRQEHTTQTQTGVDLDGFLRSLTGTLQFTSNGHETIACIPVSAADAATWEKLLAHPPQHGAGSSLGNGFYRVRETDGTTVIGGVVGDELVVGHRATVAQEQAYAHTTSTSGGGHGAVALRIALGTLIAENLHSTPNPIATKLLSAIGDLTASAQVSPQALTGTLSVQVTPPTG